MAAARIRRHLLQVAPLWPHFCADLPRRVPRLVGLAQLLHAGRASTPMPSAHVHTSVSFSDVCTCGGIRFCKSHAVWTSCHGRCAGRRPQHAAPDSESFPIAPHAAGQHTEAFHFDTPSPDDAVMLARSKPSGAGASTPSASRWEEATRACPPIIVTGAVWTACNGW